MGAGLTITTKGPLGIETHEGKKTMKEKSVSRSEMARQMHTSRASLNRLLDPENNSVTLSTLRKAASVVGREIRLELV